MFWRKKEEQKSGEIAANRLRLVIYQDRMRDRPELMQQLTQDMVEVLKSYVDIDEAELDIKISAPNAQNGDVDAPTLEVNTPIKGWKTR